jgi:hypothetical protein
MFAVKMIFLPSGDQSGSVQLMAPSVVSFRRVPPEDGIK